MALEFILNAFREHHHSVFSSFAISDHNLPPLEIDVFSPQSEDFQNP